jgi:hypothetical protein
MNPSRIQEVAMGKIGGVLIATALTLTAFTTLAQNDNHMMGEQDHMMGQGGMMHGDNQGMMNQGEHGPGMMQEGEGNKGTMHGENHDQGMMGQRPGTDDQSDDE